MTNKKIYIVKDNNGNVQVKGNEKQILLWARTYKRFHNQDAERYGYELITLPLDNFSDANKFIETICYEMTSMCLNDTKHVY